MADQGKWFKLWCAALSDPDLENLSLENWARWARFGAFLKQHGKAGQMAIKAPAIAVQNLLRVRSFEEAISVIKGFPNYHIEEGQTPPADVTANVTVATVTVIVKCSNWNKYQGDFSGSRVRRFRSYKAANVTPNVTAQEEKRREEKRREEKRVIYPTLTEVQEFAKTTNLPLDCEKFFNHYSAKGWFSGRTKIKDWRAAARNAAREWARATTGADQAKERATPTWM